MTRPVAIMGSVVVGAVSASLAGGADTTATAGVITSGDGISIPGLPGPAGASPADGSVGAAGASVGAAAGSGATATPPSGSAAGTPARLSQAGWPATTSTTASQASATARLVAPRKSVKSCPVAVAGTTDRPTSGLTRTSRAAQSRTAATRAAVASTKPSVLSGTGCPRRDQAAR